MTGTLIDLIRGQKVHIDSAIFIYYFEKDAQRATLLKELFESVRTGRLKALTSHLTLLEVLVKPIQLKRFDLVRQYVIFLSRSRNFVLQPCEEHVAQKAARIRADHGFRTPDAIQLATAVIHRAESFVTNDHRLRAFGELNIVVIDSL
jgi:predicted nucleic acid-binding protein